MTTEIILSGNLGIDYSPDEIRQQIEAARDDIAIVIDPANAYYEPEPGELPDPAEADECLSLYQALASHPQHVECYIAGPVWCESLIAMAADVVTIDRRASIRLVMAWLEEPEANVIYNTESVLAMLDPAFVEAYASGTGQSPEKIARLMAVGSKLNAKQCVTLGFADELVEGRVLRSSVKTCSRKKGKSMKTFTSNGAKAKFDRLVKARIKKGQTQRQAVIEAARMNPQLHSLALLETNQGKDGEVLNGIRERAGLKAKKVGRIRATKRNGKRTITRR